MCDNVLSIDYRYFSRHLHNHNNRPLLLTLSTFMGGDIFSRHSQNSRIHDAGRTRTVNSYSGYSRNCTNETIAIGRLAKTSDYGIHAPLIMASITESRRSGLLTAIPTTHRLNIDHYVSFARNLTSM